MKAKPPLSAGRLMAAAALFMAAAAGLIVVYYPARTMPFFFDDRVTILHNRKIQSSSLSEIISENPFRMIPNLSFALQHRLHRPPLPAAIAPLAQLKDRIKVEFSSSERRLVTWFTDPDSGQSVEVSVDRDRPERLVFPLPPVLPFRVFNLALHFINAVFLLIILDRIGLRSRFWSAAAALVFLFHPLATQSVNYITARFDLMALAFSLAAVIAHLRADEKPRADILAACFFLLAILCKESAVVLPLVVFLLDQARGKQKPHVLLGLAGSAIYAALRAQWLIVPASEKIELLSWPRYLLVEQKVTWLYVSKTLIPVHLNFDYQIISRPPLDAAFALLNLLILSASAAVVLKALISRWRKSAAPAEGRGLWPAAIALCGFLLLAPSSLIPLGDLMVEHRAYPLLALLIPALVYGLAPAAEKSNSPLPRKAAVYGLAAAMILLFALNSHSRNQVWQSELSLYADAVSKSPEKPRTLYNYACALRDVGRFEDAVVWFERARRQLKPGDWRRKENIDRNLEWLKTMIRRGAAQPP